MAKNLNNIYFPFLLLSLLLQNSIIHAIRYTVTIDMDPNSKGAVLFNNEIGSDFAKTVMENATTFIYKLFNQSEHSGERYEPDVVSLHIADFAGYGLTQGNNIKLSGTYMGSTYHGLGNTSKFLFTSVMYHEMAHVFQWTGNNMAPIGLIEGIADYVMVKSGFYQKEWYGKLGSGKKWDQGYDVTEMFLEYCDNLTSDGGFTEKLNKKMRYEYKDSYFQELLGKNVSQLWSEYKAMHGNINDTTSKASSSAWAAERNY